ncbi:MAG: hypothetical protein HY910_00535 [Desulfarculus sp.]|nr:hypothetical protein [Desulfarculus sp.]
MDPENLPQPAPTPRPAPVVHRRPSPWPWVLVLLVTAGAMFLFWYLLDEDPAHAPLPKAGQAPGQAAKPESAPAIPPPSPSQQGPVVDVTPEPPGETPALPSSEQVQRKEPYGLEKSLDAVVRSDESIKLGKETVPVAELERKLVVEGRKALLDKPLGKGQQITAWGVYAVRPGDNLWKIHYGLLGEYLSHRGHQLPPQADQPTRQGTSSGVGKVLKFAEHMVGVYNLKTGHMSRDLDLLEPGEKVVVFNLTEIFDQLAQIEPQELGGVMYDGRVLLFPKRDKPAAGKP